MILNVNLDGLYSLYKKAKKGEKIDDYEIIREFEEAFMLAIDNFLANYHFEAVKAEPSDVYDGMWIRRQQISQIEIGEIEIEAAKPTPFASLVDDYIDYIRDAIETITAILSRYNVKTIAYICSTLFWGYVVDFIDENETIIERRAFKLDELIEELWEIIKKIQE